MKNKARAEGSKVLSYLGFAAKAGKLSTGYNTCRFMMEKRRVKLLIIAKDVGESSREKMEAVAKRNGVKYKAFGSKDELSHMTGNDGKGFFAVTDENFAKVISKEIDDIESSDEEVF